MTATILFLLALPCVAVFGWFSAGALTLQPQTVARFEEFLRDERT